MWRTTALALALGVTLGSPAFAQTSTIIAACEGLGTAEVVFVGRPGPAMTMKGFGEEALSKAAEKKDRANEALTATLAAPKQFFTSPTPEQKELARKFVEATQAYNALVAQMPHAEELVLQPVQIVMPILGVSATELLVWNTTSAELSSEQAYLFYATRPFSFAPEIVKLEREPLDFLQAHGAVGLLEQAVAAGKGASVYGSLVLEDRAPKKGTTTTPLGGIPVRLKVNDTVFTGTTRANGTFSFTGVPPGLMTLEPLLPDGLTIGSHVTHENYGAGCIPVHLRAKLNGRIRGRILDEQGRPVSQQRVVLQPFQSTNAYHADARTNEDGEFEIASVAPGTYVLGVNLMDPPRCSLPYPPIFHPGTTARADATLIVVGRGTVHDGFDWNLKEKLESFSATCQTAVQ